MAQEQITVAFQVPKATANKMEQIHKWKDADNIWDINHYAKLLFLEGFNRDEAAKKAYDEQKKAEKEAEKLRKEEAKRREQQASSVPSEMND